jgi:hypothetical protein
MGGSSAPSAPPAVTTPPPIPMLQSPASVQASTTIAQRANAAIGPGAMDQTGPQGLTTPASTGTKTLLGS